MDQMHQVKESGVVHVIGSVFCKPSHKNMPDTGIDLFHQIGTQIFQHDIIRGTSGSQ